MSTAFSQPPKPESLRKHAEEKLKDGSALATHGWLTSLDALSLLHKLATSPGSASDALKLLHELQVHQIELDLQYEQLETSERELSEDLVHCARLYEFAPVCYFCVNTEGRINRVNVAGAALCGENCDELVGRRIDDFLEPGSGPILEELVTQVRSGVLGESCEVRSSAGTTFHVKAGLVPGESSILMIFVGLPDSIKSVRCA